MADLFLVYSMHLSDLSDPGVQEAFSPNLRLLSKARTKHLLEPPFPPKKIPMSLVSQHQENTSHIICFPQHIKIINTEEKKEFQSEIPMNFLCLFSDVVCNLNCARGMNFKYLNFQYCPCLGTTHIEIVV